MRFVLAAAVDLRAAWRPWTAPHLRSVELWEGVFLRNVTTVMKESVPLPNLGPITGLGTRPYAGISHPGILYSLAAGVAALSACGGASVAPPPSLPSSPVGQYNLVEYDGAPLPVTLRVIASVSAVPGDTRTSTCPEILNTSSIQIASDGGVTRTSHLSYPCTGLLPRPATLPDSTTQAEVGHESVTGDSLTFSYTATAGAEARTEYSRVTGADLVFYLSRQGTGMQQSVTSMHRVYRRQ